MHAKRSCITEVSSEENSGQRGVFISTVRQARSSAATRRTEGCSANTSTCSSCGLLGPVHTGTVSHIWRQLRGTLNLLITYTVKTATSSPLASATPHTAPATRKRRSLHQEAYTFVLGGHPFQRSHLLRQQEGFASSRAGQLQKSKQIPCDRIHGALQLDRE